MKLVCSKCLEERDITEFRKDQYNSTGYHSHCNSCANKNQRKFYKENPDHVKRYANDYYKKNVAKISEQRKLRRQNKKEEVKIYKTSDKQRTQQKGHYHNTGWLKTKERNWEKCGIIGFTYDDYEKMRLQQDNKCYICGGTHSAKHSLCIDHNHKTGKPRALLCHNCNNGMGKLKDDVILLEKVIAYLKHFDNE